MFLQRPQQHQQWKEKPWKHLPFSAIKFIAEAKHRLKISLPSFSRTSNYAVIFLVYQHHEDKNNHCVI